MTKPPYYTFRTWSYSDNKFLESSDGLNFDGKPVSEYMNTEEYSVQESTYCYDKNETEIFEEDVLSCNGLTFIVTRETPKEQIQEATKVSSTYENDSPVGF